MYEKMKIQECEERLKTSIEKGLTEIEAQKRLLENGKNILEENKKKSTLSVFLSQLKDPMIYILMVATVVSVLLKEYSDAIIIIAVVLLNALIGTVQETKAEKALEALKRMTAPTCVVKRDGRLTEIKAENLVVGDIVELTAGRTVAADLRMIETKNVKIEESSLTGESVAILKDANVVLEKNVSLGDKINMAYMSTNVVGGRGEGIVVATGMKTEVGKIAKMIKDENEQMTPLQKKLEDLGKFLGVLTIFFCVMLFVVAMLQKRNAYAMLINSISLAVAAIPEGLPAVVTIVLSLGVQRMVKVNAIVKKLPSVETLGSVSVVCSDKTGTLTQNKMVVKEIFCEQKKMSADEFQKNDLLIEGMCLCNDAVIEKKEIIGDPTEVALVEFGRKFDIKKSELSEKYKRIDEKTFDSTRKMMSTYHLYKKDKIMYTKGALDVVLKKCNRIVKNGKIGCILQDDINKINEVSREMARKALRILALAYKINEGFEEKNLIFVGVVGMKDPLRPDVKKSVQKLKEAGITTVMITGDHKDTAYAIAEELGIAQSENECVSGEQLDLMEEKELDSIVCETKVFARVNPEHKMKIVKALKKNKKIVAMTGDGVNDAPSLKAADVGIAMGITGTDVAKGAADIVLGDDNFASIEKAVEEGRTIYANIKKSVLFLLSSNFAEVITMLVAIVLGMPIPLMAVHILWINLLTDSIPALALGSDSKEEDIMKEKPRTSNESLFSNGGLKLTLLYGCLIALITIFAFISVPVAEIIKLGEKLNFSSIVEVLNVEEVLNKAQTFAFVTLAVSELLHAVGMRNVKKTFVRRDICKNKLMNFAVVAGVAIQIAVIEVPLLNVFFKTSDLNVNEWIYLIGLSFMVLVVHELIVAFKKEK